MADTLYNPTIGEIIKELEKYPSDARPIFHMYSKSFGTEIYPLNPFHTGLSVKIAEGNFQDSVYIEIN